MFFDLFIYGHIAHYDSNGNVTDKVSRRTNHSDVIFYGLAAAN